MTEVVHYFDYKSPYAYLAQDAAYALAEESGLDIAWRPYTLEIPKFLGAAELDGLGRDVVGTRNDHQWRRVRYAYMDCRREATRRGIVLRGPRKIFDSSIAHLGFLYASERGDPRAYHERAFERFFRREFDVGDPAAVAKLLEECGIASGDFANFCVGPGRESYERIQREAEAAGVFGVPSYLVDGELFWGAERMPRVRERLGLEPEPRT